VNTTTSKLKPAVIGGLVMGALSALPVVSLGNGCCCLWVICGGLVAAYMLQEQEPGPISPADGATVGLFAGVIGAFVSLVFSIPLGLLLAPMQRQLVDRLLQSGQLPPEFERFASSMVGVVGFVLGFMALLMAGVIFSTLGGLLGAAIFKRKTPPDGIDIPPSSSL
jgi:hypothetical protein